MSCCDSTSDTTCDTTCDSTCKPSIYTKDVILVMAASFFFMFSIMMVTPLINGFAQSLGTTALFAGVITGSMSIISLFLRPVAGNLSDHFSKYRLSCIGGALIALGVFGCAWAPEGSLLLAFRILNGCGFVLATVCMTTWLGLLVPREHVGEAMGFYGLMNALAMAVAPACSMNLVSYIGYRPCLALAGMSAVAMLISIQFVSDHARPVNVAAAQPSQPAQASQPASTSQPAQASQSACARVRAGLNALRHIRILQKNAFPISLLMLLFSIPYFATQADILLYVQEGHLNVAVGYFFVVYAIVLLIIRMTLKRYFDTVPYGKWFWKCLLASALFLIGMAFMVNTFMMIVCAALLSVGYGVIYSINQSTAMMLAPTSEQGLASSTFYLGLDIGMSTAPILGGYLYTAVDRFWFYPSILFIVPLCIVVYMCYKDRLNSAIYVR